jgi:phosphomannomutase
VSRGSDSNDDEEVDQARARARAWAAADPDADTRAETEALVLAGDDEVLRARFSGHLGFGTAGIRGPVGVGPQRVNRLVVRLVADALGDRVGHGARVVVGHDARLRSDVFADDVAGVLRARGVDVVELGAVPTPVVAFSVGHLGAAAGVMVTASHNPPSDNGLKVYGADGAQVVAPLDAQLAAALAGDPRALPDPVPAPAGTASGRREELLGAYLDAVVVSAVGPAASSGPGPRIAYSPLHGVGGELTVAALARAGFTDVHEVADQRRPDGRFPTVPTPNPEAHEALDHVLALGDEVGADLVLAHDPDADRLAVAVPAGDGGSGWWILSGDEVGALLGEHLLARAGGSTPRPLVVSTFAGSRLLARIAAHHDAVHVETPPGFKWVMRSVLEHPELRFTFAYEEALGFAVGGHVRDKDAIAAALAVADLVRVLAADGRTLADEADRLARRHGLHTTSTHAVPIGSAEVGVAVVARLRDDPPAVLGGRTVTAVVDPAPEGPARGSAVGLVLADGSRIVVRPSGTEPKVKCYLEVVEHVDDGPSALAAARADAEARLASLWADLVTFIRRAPAPGR